MRRLTSAVGIPALPALARQPQAEVEEEVKCSWMFSITRQWSRLGSG